MFTKQLSLVLAIAISSGSFIGWNYADTIGNGIAWSFKLYDNFTEKVTF